MGNGVGSCISSVNPHLRVAPNALRGSVIEIGDINTGSIDTSCVTQATGGDFSVKVKVPLPVML